MPNRLAPPSRFPGLLIAGIVLTALGVPGTGAAQGVTTAAVRGTVRMSDGSDPVGARVSVRNSATGYLVEAEVRNGRFLVPGLEVGGPYSVTLRRIGARAERRDIGFLSLGEPRELHLVLESAPQILDSVMVRVARPGPSSSLSDSLVHHLPSLNRDVYDFVRLVPQISTRVGQGFSGMSGGGVGFRFNNFLINGAPQRSLAGGQPPEFAGAKSLPFEAVGEYQVLLAPFDVRFGDFAGAAVNIVTRSGTNQLRGSVFAQFRNDGLARSDVAEVSPYQRTVFGFSLSGPIVRDHAHFLIVSEFQRLTSPMAGPFVGQPANAIAAVPVRESDLARLDEIMRTFGLESGSGGAVPNRNPLRNLFARVDARLPLSSRAVLWVANADAENLSFARLARDTTFALSSQASATNVGIWTAALQIHSGHNELFLSRRSTRNVSSPAVRQPIVSVLVPGVAGSGPVSIVTGTPTPAQGIGPRSHNFDLRDNLTVALAESHLVTLGLEAEWFVVEAPGLFNRFGTWSFSSLDSLQAGLADRFEVARDFGGGTVPLKGAQYAVYAGDQWQLGERLSLTLGMRADLLDIDGRPPYNRLVDSIFGRRTDQRLPRAVHFSPRAGFTWDPDGTGRNRLRGGAGVFTGRPPLAWLHMPFLAYGFGTGTLRCGGGPSNPGPAPLFQPDPLDPPVACPGGLGTTPAGDVELIEPGLRMPTTLRANLAWDRWLTGDLLASVEALYTRNRSDIHFVNLNLAGPQSVDAQGRTLYGTFDPIGRANPVLRARTLPGVIEARNVSANHSTQLSARLEKRFARGSSLTAAYTWSRVRDVQTPLRVNNRGVINWSSRAMSGRHEDLRADISLNDIPHRIILAGTWRAPWAGWTTELSLLYVGESGSPFPYRAFGLRGLGDLNADGSNVNDPIYVPRDATDPGEISFIDAGQPEAFEGFIEGNSCLRRQRGRILERNSCREPWTHTSVISLRQRIPVRTRGVEAQLDLFNLLNLLDGDWGLRRVAEPALLEHVGQASGPGGVPRPVFRFKETASPWTVLPAESSYQLQLGLAYRF